MVSIFGLPCTGWPKKLVDTTQLGSKLLHIFTTLLVKSNFLKSYFT